MNEYMEGATVRVTALFKNPVDTNVYFELDAEKCQYGTPSEHLIIVLDPSNNKRCYVDIDTFGNIGVHNYHFYSRGSQKAADKGSFRVL